MDSLAISSRVYDSLQFIRPVRALYATSPLWDPQFSEPPFVLTEYATCVLGPRSYRPIPFQAFQQSAIKLCDIGAIEIRPSDLREWYETNALQDSMDDLGSRVFLYSNVCIRFRKDSPITRDSYDIVHGLIMVGTRSSIEHVAEQIGFPHPFNNTQYPYKNLFRDPRQELPVLL